jgi:integrase/recombinase XerC
MNKELKLFLEHLAYERRLSNHTVEAYRADLEHFSQWAQSRFRSDDFLLRLDHYNIREYLSFCYQRYKNISIARRLSGLRTFFKFMVRLNIVAASPADLIENPKVSKPLPKPVSVEEAFCLCEQGPEKDAGSARNKAMWELLYASGIRISELVGLNIHHIDLKTRLIRVMGKGKKERIVPIHETCAKSLEQWINSFRPLLIKDILNEKALFVGERGERIHARVIRSILRALGQRMDLSHSLHPHRLRHAYATHMLESGADLRSIQELLGHATIASTERYMDVDLASLMQQYDKAHPHAKKKST